MQTSKRKIWLALLGLAAVLLILVAIVMYPQAQSRWNAPLGPVLELPSITPVEATLVSVGAAATATGEDPTSETPPTIQIESETATLPATLVPTETSSPTATPRPLCGGPPSMIVLGTGVDSRDNTYLYGLADVIRIVRVDFVIPRVTVLTLPRDIWVEIPGIGDHGVTEGKLNQSFFYGGSGMGYYDGAGEGPGLMALTLLENFGLRVDHYGAIDMGTFVRVVDAVGGIDVDLPDFVDGRAIDEKTIDLGVFYAGEQHLDGEDALRLARIRKKYNDYKRQDNQNIVLCALKEKVLSPAVLPKVPEIIAAFQDSVLTSLSPAEISQLACLGPMLRDENLLFTRLPEDLLQPVWIESERIGGSTFALSGDNQVIRQYLAEFQAGTWPTESGQPSCGE